MRRQTKQNRRKLVRKTRRLRGGVNVKGMAEAIDIKAAESRGFKIFNDVDRKCASCGGICEGLAKVLKCQCKNDKKICPT